MGWGQVKLQDKEERAVQPPSRNSWACTSTPAGHRGALAGLAMGLQFSVPQFPCLFPLLIRNLGVKHALCLRGLPRRLNEMVGVKA